MAVTDKPWDGSASRWDTAADYCQASLVNENSGDPASWTKDKCHLPVYEPDGDLNSNGVSAAAGRLAGTQISPALKHAAAVKLVGLYRKLNKPVPDTVQRLAK